MCFYIGQTSVDTVFETVTDIFYSSLAMDEFVFTNYTLCWTTKDQTLPWNLRIELRVKLEPTPYTICTLGASGESTSRLNTCF